MKKLEIYQNLMEMGFDIDDVKRETLSNRIKWVMGLMDCDYQSAYRAVKAVRCGEDMSDFVFAHDWKKAKKELKGIRSWWNRNVKKQYRTSLTENEFILECIDEYMNTGNVEIRSFYSKTNCPMTW